MPYKDPQKAREHRREYTKRPEVAEKLRVQCKEYQRTPYGKFMMQRKEAVNERKLEWLLTFEEWWQIWQDSGYWEERGPVGYHMCRIGDEGPYSVDNVYIAYHLVNKQHQYENGHRAPPPIRSKLTSEQRKEIFYKLQETTIKMADLAKEYAISVSIISTIKNGRQDHLFQK